MTVIIVIIFGLFNLEEKAAPVTWVYENTEEKKYGMSRLVVTLVRLKCKCYIWCSKATGRKKKPNRYQKQSTLINCKLNYVLYYSHKWQYMHICLFICFPFCKWTHFEIPVSCESVVFDSKFIFIGKLNRFWMLPFVLNISNWVQNIWQIMADCTHAYTTSVSMHRPPLGDVIYHCDLV